MRVSNKGVNSVVESDYIHGDLEIDYPSAQYIAWNPKELKAVAKTFTTVKMNKDTPHVQIISFDGAFAGMVGKPSFMFGLKGFLVEGNRPLRISSGLVELSSEKAVVKVTTEGDTEVTATFLCFASPAS